MIDNFWKKKDETMYFSELSRFISFCQLLAERAPDCDNLPDAPNGEDLSNITCLKYSINLQHFTPKYICKDYDSSENRCFKAYVYVHFTDVEDDFKLKLKAARKTYRRSTLTNLFITDSTTYIDDENEKEKCLENNCSEVYFGCRIY